MELVLALSVIVCLFTFICYQLLKYMNDSPKKYLSLYRCLLIAFILGVTCVLFPIKIGYGAREGWRLFIMILSCYSIGTSFKELFGIRRQRFVYLLTFAITCLGMASKYIIEYGEISNTHNFTPLNIIIYIATIPAFTLYVYERKRTNI